MLKRSCTEYLDCEHLLGPFLRETWAYKFLVAPGSVLLDDICRNTLDLTLNGIFQLCMVMCPCCTFAVVEVPVSYATHDTFQPEWKNCGIISGALTWCQLPSLGLRLHLSPCASCLAVPEAPAASLCARLWRLAVLLTSMLDQSSWSREDNHTDSASKILRAGLGSSSFCRQNIVVFGSWCSQDIIVASRTFRPTFALWLRRDQGQVHAAQHDALSQRE